MKTKHFCWIKTKSAKLEDAIFLAINLLEMLMQNNPGIDPQPPSLAQEMEVSPLGQPRMECTVMMLCRHDEVIKIMDAKGTISNFKNGGMIVPQSLAPVKKFDA